MRGWLRAATSLPRRSALLPALMAVFGWALTGCGAGDGSSTESGEPSRDQARTFVDREAAADAFLREAQPTALGGAQAVLQVGDGSAGSRFRALVRFDLSWVPADAQVSRAELRLYLDNLAGASGVYTVHRYTGAWTEATATWAVHAGQFDPTVAAQRTLDASLIGRRVTFNLRQLAQEWVRTPSANRGLLLRGPESLAGQRAFLGSREQSLPFRRPVLVLEYVDPNAGITLTPVASGLTAPVFLTHAGDGSGRMFVVEQPGYVRLLQGGVVSATPFLDIHTRVKYQGERGLLGLAFHPQYAGNGRFFVFYSTSAGGQMLSRLSEFAVSAQPDEADPASERVLLEIVKPEPNHNGGMIAFGPDGKLYIGTGDGGGSGDPGNNAQNLGSLLGKLLRIDVDAGSPYGIPPDNPFAGQAGARPEVWAYGFRNPWRWSFDRRTGRLFLADVGQARWEEIDLIRRGGNYGWRVMEGRACFPNGSVCSSAGLQLPIHQYDHTLGCSVTGGYVYRGNRHRSLDGHFFFADYCAGTVWSLAQDATGRWVRRELATSVNVTSFGEDEQGEVYLVRQDGAIERLDAS